MKNWRIYRTITKNQMHRLVRSVLLNYEKSPPADPTYDDFIQAEKYLGRDLYINEEMHFESVFRLQSSQFGTDRGRSAYQDLLSY